MAAMTVLFGALWVLLIGIFVVLGRYLADKGAADRRGDGWTEGL